MNDDQFVALLAGVMASLDKRTQPQWSLDRMVPGRPLEEFVKDARRIIAATKGEP